MVEEYVMINKQNGAVIRTSPKYLNSWLARGFEVLEIVMEDGTVEKSEDGNGSKHRTYL